jgi:predicted ATPase
MILTLAISGYRSIRDLVLPLERLNAVTGGNGAGKSSLYRALRLLADVAQGRAIAALAQEGGLQSTLWAGPEIVSKAVKRGQAPVQPLVRKNSVALKLGFASEDYGYAIDLGLAHQPGPPGSRAGRQEIHPDFRSPSL